MRRRTGAKQIDRQPPLGRPGNFTPSHPLAGSLSLHRKVRDPRDGQVKHLDDITGGRGWRLLGWHVDPLRTPLSQLADRVREALGIASYVLTAEADVTGDFARWFADEVRGDVVLVRPDFYVATAGRAEDLSALLEEVDGLLHGLLAV